MIQREGDSRKRPILRILQDRPTSSEGIYWTLLAIVLGGLLGAFCGVAR